MRVLHFAPEIVLEPLFRKLKNWEYTTADIMEGLADKAFDMQNIPFEDNYFDFVIASHVTSYTEDEPLALRELARILKPETGVLLQLTRIHLPTEKSFTGGILDTQEREKTYGFDPFVKWVHGRDYVAILEKNNLKVKSIHYSDLVDIDFAEKNGFINSENEIFDGETIYFCTKNCE